MPTFWELVCTFEVEKEKIDWFMFHLIQALLIAFAVAIDAATVAACEGICRGNRRTWSMLFAIALIFGVLQGGITAIGYFVGAEVVSLVAGYDHWVAFVLLIAVGGHMIYDAFVRARQAKNASRKLCEETALTMRYMLYLMMMGVATSIDALALGFSFSLMSVPILLYALTIGIVTAVASGAAFYVGSKIPSKWISWTELFGGWVLVGIGAKVLLEHLEHAY